MTDRIEAGVQEFRPSLSYRFWQAIGFRHGAYVPPPEDEETHYIRHRVVTHWDWRDRMRILVSGKTEVSMLVESEGPWTFRRAHSHAVVLAPGARS